MSALGFCPCAHRGKFAIARADGARLIEAASAAASPMCPECGGSGTVFVHRFEDTLEWPDIQKLLPRARKLLRSLSESPRIAFAAVTLANAEESKRFGSNLERWTATNVAIAQTVFEPKKENGSP